MIARVALSIVALSFLIFIPSLHGKESDTEYNSNRPGTAGHGKLPPGLNGGGPPGLNRGGPPSLNRGGPPGLNRGGPPVSVTTHNRYGGSERSCRTNEFRCNNGECVSRELICNKVNDCDDGSDEADCSRTQSPEQDITDRLSQRPNTTHTSEFDSVSISHRILFDPSSSTDGCILPPQPQGGKYEVVSHDETSGKNSNDKVPVNTTLVYRCHDRYVLRGNPSSMCINNKWTELTTCALTCPPLKSNTVDIFCTYQGKTVSCDEDVEIGTQARLSCKQSHELPFTSDPVYREIVCLEDATWNHLLYKCMPKCGEVQYVQNRIVFPWYISIYEKSSANITRNICGGTLISNNLILSVAHCFYDDGNHAIKDPSRYYVAAGKHRRDWDIEEITAQQSEVLEIMIKERYLGLAGNYGLDIAMLKLATPFVLTPSVQPVCVDWDNVFEKKQLTKGQVGKVIGWTRGTDGGYGDTLEAIDVPYVSYSECSMAIPVEFRPFITPDKFCAGNLTGSSLCYGPSGSGFFFEMEGVSYIRGIASVSTQRNQNCDANAYVGFSQVSHFLEWIRSIYLMQ